MDRRQSGFTLIEIAIVLVIIGLLLGGVLKGQELITSARVRNLISQQDGIKAAYFGFLDRYRALPGDYAAAVGNIPDVTQNGDGNGQIATTTGNIIESVLVWEHLSRAGFIHGAYTYAAAPADASNPRNPYGAFVQLIWDQRYGDPGGAAPAARHNLKTGRQLPVEILAEVDRKIDDGRPYTGTFQFSDFDGAQAACVTGNGPAATWAAVGGEANCGGATLF
jgi:prepilin-type N-terminal cleavage/methylation domain-containing protein